jgi:hypothetical protein
MASKEERILKIMKRWLNGEIKADQADRELQQITRVKLPKANVKLSKGNEG